MGPKRKRAVRVHVEELGDSDGESVLILFWKTKVRK